MSIRMHPFLAFAHTLPVDVFEVEAMSEIPKRWTIVGDPPTHDAAIVMDVEMRVGVAWATDRRHEGEALEALAHELGHLFGHREPGQILASEEAAITWEIDANRQLDMRCPITRGMARKAAAVADGEDFEWPPSIEAWIRGVLRG